MSYNLKKLVIVMSQETRHQLLTFCIKGIVRCKHLTPLYRNKGRGIKAYLPFDFPAAQNLSKFAYSFEQIKKRKLNCQAGNSPLQDT